MTADRPPADPPGAKASGESAAATAGTPGTSVSGEPTVASLEAATWNMVQAMALSKGYSPPVTGEKAPPLRFFQELYGLVASSEVRPTFPSTSAGTSPKSWYWKAPPPCTTRPIDNPTEAPPAPGAGPQGSAADAEWPKIPPSAYLGGWVPASQLAAAPGNLMRLYRS